LRFNQRIFRPEPKTIAVWRTAGSNGDACVVTIVPIPKFPRERIGGTSARRANAWVNSLILPCAF